MNEPSSAPQLTLTAVPDFPLIQPGDDLATIILERLAAAGMALQDGDIVVIAQKVVSKAEGRLVHLGEVVPSQRAREIAAQADKDPRLVEVILQDTREISRVRRGLIIVEHRLGFICANAGVDRSNVAPDARQEWVAQLPRDPDASARRIRRRLTEATGHQVAVIINDTHGRPWRVGAVGLAIGVAGMAPVQDLRGHADLFGHALQTTQVGLADQVAAAASLVMGQADEGRPVVIVRGLRYAVREDASAQEILRPREQDLYR
jgi:coenzyme F420-0:L-glutamate ligase/coenzyme F420-1:gamma-L-glutamate ligase